MNKKYQIPAIGSRFGTWIVIDNEPQLNFNSKSKSKLNVKVQCECGTTKIQSYASLIRMGTLKCRDCENKSRVKFHGEIAHSFFKSIKHNAEVRNLDFNITIDYMWDLFLEQDRCCKLSGLELILNPYANWSKALAIQTASLDRIDSSKGYVKGNVQWIHKAINRMKFDLNQEQFLNLCNAISKNDKRKLRTQIACRFQIVGIHRWKDCNIEEVAYLRNYHRHTFHIICEQYVRHNDRDIEFIKLANDVRLYLEEKYYKESVKCCFFGDLSCESIADEILTKFKLWKVEVNEDGEGGAIVTDI